MILQSYDERRSDQRTMRRARAIPGGQLEQAALVVLWELGRASTREIHARIGEPRGLVYTTTAKVLDRLYAKALVARERVGKVFVYRPRVKREVMERARAKHSVGWLLQRERPAIATLVDAVEALDPELLDELARVVAARRRRRHQR
jgi:BlaI family penicillinase repressor